VKKDITIHTRTLSSLRVGDYFIPLPVTDQEVPVYRVAFRLVCKKADEIEVIRCHLNKQGGTSEVVCLPDSTQVILVRS
jgi:hypothetical protein